MDFLVEKKDLDSALKQVLFGRVGTPEDYIDVTLHDSVLTLAATGTRVEIPVVSESSENVALTVGDLARLKKVSATYKGGPIRIRIGDGRIHFHKTSLRYHHSTALTRCDEEARSEGRAIDIPNDATLLDLYSLPAIFSSQEIEDCGLGTRVQKAKESVARMNESAVSSMGEFGFTRAEVSAMTEAKLNSHAATMRRVFFPDELPSECEDEQQARSNTISVESTRPGEKQMNEAEMKAELERLRAENAQLKTKEKSGITLKVSEKGAVSLYGMGKFPVTLYKEQWLRVLAAAPEIEKFIRDNEGKLKTKE